MYNPKSMKAEEFIDHQEILDTLAYADEHKRDAELISAIIEKAKEYKGLSHREASVLLACELEDKNQEITFFSCQNSMSPPASNIFKQPIDFDKNTWYDYSY